MQIGKLHEEKKVSDDLFALACLPDKRVRVYSTCIVDGVRYHTVVEASIARLSYFAVTGLSLVARRRETLLSNMMATSKASTLQGAGIRVIPLF